MSQSTSAVLLCLVVCLASGPVVAQEPTSDVASEAASEVQPSPTAGAACATSGSGSALRRAADGLAAGEWCHFDSSSSSAGATYNNMTDDVMTGFSECCAHFLWTYSDSFAWWKGASPGNGYVKFIGTPHSNSGDGVGGLIVYDEAANDWSQVSVPWYNGSYAAHGYDHNAFDSSTGSIYRITSDYHIGTFDYHNGSGWQTTGRSSQPNWSADHGKAIAEFPELNDAGFSGGFVVVSGSRSLNYYAPSTDTWSSDRGGVSFNNSYHFAAQYNPVHQVVWLMDGNGNSVHYKLAADGTLTSLAAPSGNGGPSGFGVTTNVVSVDGIGGDFVVWNCRADAWYEYDITTDSWATISHSMPPAKATILGCGDGSDTAEVSITSYGVIGYIIANGDHVNGPYDLYLYRHGNGSAPVIPSPPPSLHAE